MITLYTKNYYKSFQLSHQSNTSFVYFDFNTFYYYLSFLGFSINILVFVYESCSAFSWKYKYLSLCQILCWYPCSKDYCKSQLSVYSLLQCQKGNWGQLFWANAACVIEVQCNWYLSAKLFRHFAFHELVMQKNAWSNASWAGSLMIQKAGSAYQLTLQGSVIV